MITMTEQIQNFAMIKSNITARIGTKTADHLLSKSIFLISTGGNDVFAYYSQINSPNNTGEELFVTTLVSKYGDHVKVIFLSFCLRIIVFVYNLYRYPSNI